MDTEKDCACVRKNLRRDNASSINGDGSLLLLSTADLWKTLLPKSVSKKSKKDAELVLII